MNPPLVVTIGELLWDQFPDGEDRLGGATANVAFHVAQLGGRAALVSCVGSDTLGESALRFLRAYGLDTSYIAVERSGRPTGTVQVTLDPTTGEPAYTIVENVAWDHIPWSAALQELACTCQAVCFGTLAQRSPVSRATIRKFVETAQQAGALIVCDVNLRDTPQLDVPMVIIELLGWSLYHSQVGKFNEEEYTRRFHVSAVTDETVQSRNSYGLDTLAVTRGARGASLFHWKPVIDADASYSGKEFMSVNGRAEAAPGGDPVGAGDAFTASLILGLLEKKPLQRIVDDACEVGAFVAGQSGAMVRQPGKANDGTS